MIYKIESSIVKEVFLPNRESCICDKYFNDLTNSVLAFVREVREIGERHGFLKAWLRKFNSEVHQNTIWEGKYISLNETWFRINHSVPDGLGG